MGEGDIQYKKTRGWKWTGKEVGGSGVAARLEAWADGLEAIRLTPSDTGVDIRLLGDTPATNYILFDASGPSLTLAGSTTLTVAGALTVSSGGLTITAGVLSQDDVTDSTSTVTGSIHTDGGLGVAKETFLGGNLTMADAKNIIVGSSTGTKIGTATTQKLGLYNTAPTAQQAHINDAPAGGAGAAAGAWDTAAHRDAAIATINAILVRLETLGIVASA